MEEIARDDELAGDVSVGQDAPVGYGVTNSEPPRKKWLVPALSAGLVVALAAAAVFGVLYLTQDTSAQEIEAALAEETPDVEDRAGSIANLLLNYDSTNLDEVSRQMLDLATGSFRQQYEEALEEGGGLGTALEEASASSRGQILTGPDVFFRSADEAIAIMRVTQTAQSNSNPGGQTIDYVLKVTFIDTSDGGWKADRVEVLSTQQV